MKNKYIFVTVLLLALAGLCGAVSIFGNRSMTKEEDVKRIVTSFYPIYILTENVTEDIEGVEVVNLTQAATGCLHDYQMRPEDLVSLSEADAFVINGGGMEDFLSDVFEAYPNLPVIEVCGGIELMAEDEEEENAHFWMDPARYCLGIENVANALSELDPGHEEQYKTNAKRYTDEVEALCEELEPLKAANYGLKTIVFHDAFAYLADAIGMEVAAVVDLDEDTSLSAGMLSEIVDDVKNSEIPILFTEKQFGTQLADAVSKETGARVCVIDSLVTGSYDPDSYIDGMKKNLVVLKELTGEY